MTYDQTKPTAEELPEGWELDEDGDPVVVGAPGRWDAKVFAYLGDGWGWLVCASSGVAAQRGWPPPRSWREAVEACNKARGVDTVWPAPTKTTADDLRAEGAADERVRLARKLDELIGRARKAEEKRRADGDSEGADDMRVRAAATESAKMFLLGVPYGGDNDEAKHE